MKRTVKKSNINIQNIADLSGVSAATVSRVLNHNPNVKEETRTRVLDVIRRVNYYPSQTARSLSNSRTDCVGLIVPNSLVDVFTDPYFPIIIRAIYKTAQSYGYTVILGLGTDEDEQSLFNRLVERRMVDGVLMLSPLDKDWLTTAFNRSRIPCVSVGRSTELKCSFVDVDNYAATRTGTEHLIRLGYQRIGTITGPMAMWAGQQRFLGCKETVEMHGFSMPDELIFHGDFTERAGHMGMRQMLPYKPEAVLCANDRMAIGAIHAVRESGLRVPEDVAVIGFDDNPMAAEISPALTTIRQPISLSGQTATEILMQLIDNPEMPIQQIIVPTELVIRESCGALIRATQ